MSCLPDPAGKQTLFLQTLGGEAICFMLQVFIQFVFVSKVTLGSVEIRGYKRKPVFLFFVFFLIFAVLSSPGKNTWGRCSRDQKPPGLG